MTKPSVNAFEHYRSESQRFEYFMIGVSVALCAYIGQTIKPEKFAFSPYTLEVISVALIAASVVAGFKRLEQIVFGHQLNADLRYLEERCGTLVAAFGKGGFVDEGSGELWDRDAMKQEIENIQRVLPDRRRQLEDVQGKLSRLYRWRNWLLAIGFVGLLLSKLLSPYVVVIARGSH